MIEPLLIVVGISVILLLLLDDEEVDVVPPVVGPVPMPVPPLLVILFAEVDEVEEVVLPPVPTKVVAVLDDVVELVPWAVVLVLLFGVKVKVNDVLLLESVEEVENVVREVIPPVPIVPLPATVVSLRPYNAALARLE